MPIERLFTWFDSLRADAVFGWRQLKKRKVTSAAAILSLGLALGACTAAFRLMDALFLRPLPISDPHNLFVLVRPAADKAGDGWEHVRFREMRAAMKDDAELTAVSSPERTDLIYGPDRAVEKGYVQYVSGWMFRSFGLRPASGRLLSETDDRKAGAHPVAVLSYEYWTRRFGRDPKAVGSTVAIAPKYGMGSEPFEIVGVAAEGFTGTEPGTETDLFVPAMTHPLVNLPVASLFRILVRVRPGNTPGAIRDRLDSFLHALNEQDRKEAPSRPNQTVLLERAASGVSTMRKEYGQALAALGGLVGLLLMIAGANAASLLSAQTMARAREMAVRVSIGANRGRMAQLVLVESAITALLAAMIGVVVACLATPFVLARINPPENPARLSLTPDWRVLLGGLALALFVTLLLGLGPALRVSLLAPGSALRGGENPRSRGRFLRVLVALQAALCLVVLFVASLFGASFARLSHIPAGFSVDRLLALDIVTPRDEPPSAWEQVVDHLRSVPGIDSAALSDWPLLDGISYRLNRVSVEGETPADSPVRFLIVSPGWVDTMKLPLIQGRDFRPGETGVAIVNQAFVRQYFARQDPTGKWFEAKPGGDWGRRFRIVAVAGDTRYRAVRDAIVPIVYVPFILPWHHETVMVRVARPGNTARAQDLASVVRQEVARAHPGFRVSEVRTEKALIDAQTVRERLLSILGIFFAVLALLLAGIGLYGVLNDSVVRRQREIGIRRAVGAQASDVAAQILFNVLALLLAGVLSGLALSLFSAKYVEPLLYQVKATDLSVWELPGMALIAAGVLAALPPLCRALRIDPANVLRAE